MKKIVAFIAAAMLGITAFAQQAEEILSKMETDKAWYIACKKLKTNTNKDDPKNMEIVVAKGSYMPLSLSAKTKGITITIKDLAYGVKESDVTFDSSKYPGATIVDKRESAAK